jgi:methionyl-tRNA formyltransferase
MRLFFFGNNELAVRVLEFLVQDRAPIVGLAVHPLQRAKFADRLKDLSGLPPECIFNGETLRQAHAFEAIRDLKVDLGLSVKFGYILKAELFGIFPQGCLNLHTSFLPYNRGANPNVWSIVEGTPAGVSLHFVDAGIDTGPIVSQKQVEVSLADTGLTLYQKLEEAAYRLFMEEWPAIKAGQIKRSNQPGSGTYHAVIDYESLQAIDPNKMYRASELINILRACTFPPHSGAYLDLPDRRIYVNIDPTEEMK